MGASEVNSDEGADPDEEGEKRKKRKKKKGLLRKVVKSLNCCSALHHTASEPSEPPYEPGGVTMGPLTLSEFIDTLEPYDPSIHGWRGQEPRPHWHGLASPRIHPKSGLRPNRASIL